MHFCCNVIHYYQFIFIYLGAGHVLVFCCCIYTLNA